MPIQGDLRTMPVPELLMWIGQHQKTGTLEVSIGEWKGRLAFDQGFLIFSSSSDLAKTFGRLLIAKGLITEAQYEQARRVREEQEIAIAKVLSDLNVLPEAEIIRLLRKKAESELFDLFKRDEGEFRFLDHQLPDLDLLPLRIDIAKAILRVTQHMDENKEYDFDSSGTRHDIPKL